MAGWHDNLLRETLREPIEAGRIEVFDDGHDVVDALYARFPTCDGRLDWERTEGHRGAQILDPAVSRTAAEGRESIEAFLTALVDDGEVRGTDRVWVVFDSLVDVTLSTDVGTLRATLVDALDCVPAAALVVAQDLAWAIAYSFHDFMEFGRPPPAPASDAQGRQVIRPFSGLGPISFGMSTAACDAALPGEGETFLRVCGKPESAVTEYADAGLFLSFDADDQLHFVEAFAGDIELAGVPLLGRSLDVVVAELAAAGVVGSPSDVGHQFPEHGVGLYAPNGPVDGVSLYRRDAND